MTLDAATKQVYDAIVFVTFVVLLVVITGWTSVRWLRYRRAHLPVPLLLKRDVIFWAGLSVPIGSLFLARFLGWTGLAYNLGWLLVTTVPFFVGMGVFAYLEVFIIDRQPRRTHDADVPPLTVLPKPEVPDAP